MHASRSWTLYWCKDTGLQWVWGLRDSTGERAWLHSQSSLFLVISSPTYLVPSGETLQALPTGSPVQSRFTSHVGKNQRKDRHPITVALTALSENRSCNKRSPSLSCPSPALYQGANLAHSKSQLRSISWTWSHQEASPLLSLKHVLCQAKVLVRVAVPHGVDPGNTPPRRSSETQGAPRQSRGAFTDRHVALLQLPWAQTLAKSPPSAQRPAHRGWIGAERDSGLSQARPAAAALLPGSGRLGRGSQVVCGYSRAGCSGPPARALSPWEHQAPNQEFCPEIRPPKPSGPAPCMILSSASPTSSWKRPARPRALCAGMPGKELLLRGNAN